MRSQARRGRAFGHPLQRRLLRWFHQSVEDAFTDAGMVSKSASTAARVVLSTREGDFIHVAGRRRRREPVHQYIAGHIERDLGRKTIEYLVYLRGQRRRQPAFPLVKEIHSDDRKNCYARAFV